MAKVEVDKTKEIVYLDKVNFFANNFNFLRFLAATMVIVGHSFPLYGSSFDPLAKLTGTLSLGPLALYIFFIISGFLITKSWIDKPELISYFKKRILRILPGLILATLFGFLIIGPLTTTVSLKDYFSDLGSWDYLRNIFFQTRNYIPHTLEHNPYSTAINGSLWSLPVEFWMYIMVAILGLFGFLTKRKVFIPFLVLAIIVFNWHIITKPQFKDMPVLGISALQFFRLALFFALGSVYYLYRKLVVVDWRVCLFAFGALIASFFTVHSDLMLIITLPYLVISTAYLFNYPFLRKFGSKVDLSYGYMFLLFRSSRP